MHTTTRRWSTRLLSGAVGVLACLVLAAGSAIAQGEDEERGAQTWSVQPANEDGADGRASWDFALEPGESVEDYALITNFGEEALTFDVYSHDAVNTPDGAFTLQPADAESVEVGAWIGLDEQVTVEPGDSSVVPFTIAVPEDAVPGDHAGGIVASITSEATDDEGQQVLVDNRVGSRIYLRVAGELDPVLAVEVVDAEYVRSSWLPFTSGEVTVTYLVRNAGNVRLAGEQEATVHGLFGMGEQTVTLDELREVLPGQAITSSAVADGVAPLVRVTGEVFVDPVPPEATGAEVIPPVRASAATTMWVVPWPELIIIAMLAVGVWWTWRRRRQRKSREATLVADAVAKGREEARKELHAGATTEADKTATVTADVADDATAAESAGAEREEA